MRVSPLPQVDLAQVVLLHQFDQAADAADIENVLHRGRDRRRFVRLISRRRMLTRFFCRHEIAHQGLYATIASSNRHREAGQDFVPRAGNKDIVFDSDPTPAGEINPRLDRNHHPRFQLDAGLGGQARALMDFQAKAVAQAMPKISAETGLGDESAAQSGRSSSQIAPGRMAAIARSWASNTTLYTRSSLGEILPVRSTRVKSLSIKPAGRAPIDQHRGRVADGPLGWVGMGQRRPRTCRHNRSEGRPPAAPKSRIWCSNRSASCFSVCSGEIAARTTPNPFSAK